MRETLCLFAALLALAGPAFTQTLPRGVQQKASLGGITEYAYPNGLRVLLFPDSVEPQGHRQRDVPRRLAVTRATARPAWPTCSST